jgi:glycosyltransferase involved in cell wall biosynthesis
MERFIIKRCNEVITVNESISNELSTRYNIPKPHVIMNYPCFEKSSNISYNLNQNIKILYHGGFAKERGIEEIIESMKYTDKRFLLYMRGFDESDNNPYKKFLNNIIESNNLSNRVFFIPRVPMKDLIKSIDSYDIGIIPYKPTCLNNLYASPNKTFEYMMGGLALAVSDIPEQRKIIDTYKNGVYFNPNSPKNISDSLNSILEDPARISEMKNKSLHAAEQFLNWEKQEYKLISIISQYII